MLKQGTEILIASIDAAESEPCSPISNSILFTLALTRFLQITVDRCLLYTDVRVNVRVSMTCHTAGERNVTLFLTTPTSGVSLRKSTRRLTTELFDDDVMGAFSWWPKHATYFLSRPGRTSAGKFLLILVVGC